MAEQLSRLSPKEQRRLEFDGRVHALSEATMILSGPRLDNPLGEEVLSFGAEAIPWLLEYLREYKDVEKNSEGDFRVNPWVALETLDKIVPANELPQIPEEASGKLDPVLDILDAWGVEKGYIPQKINH